MHPAIRRFLTSKYFFIPAGTLLFYTLIGFFILPLALGWYVPKAAHDQLKCGVRLGKVRINPFQMSFEATGFSLSGPDGTALASFERLFIDLEPSGIFRRTAKIREITLAKPTLQVVFEADGETNLAKLIPKSAAEPPPPPPSSSKPLRLLLQTVALVGGEVTITDKRQSIPATLTFRDLELNLKDLSTLLEQTGAYSLSTTTPNGETVQTQGEIGLAPWRLSGQIACRNIQAATLWGFVRDTLRLEPPAGKIDVSTAYQIDLSRSPLQLALNNFQISLADASLRLAETDKPFLELNKLGVDAARFDLPAKSIQVGKILVDGGRLHWFVDENGTSNFEKTLRPAQTPKQTATMPSPPAAKTPPASPPEAAPWKVDLETIEIKDIGFDLEDRNRVLPLAAGFSSLSLSSSVKIEAGAKTPKILIQHLVAEVKEIRVGNKGATDPLVTADRFFVEGGEADLGAGTVALARLGLSAGRIGISRDKNGEVDLQQLFTSRNAAPPSPGAEAPPWKIKAPAVEIKDLAFNFDDLSTATPVAYGVSNISASSSVEIRTGSNTDVAVKEFSSELHGLRLGSKGGKDPAFEAQRFFVQGGEVDLGARTVSISSLGLSDGRLDVGRERDGRLNLERLFVPKSALPSDKKGKKITADNGPAWKYAVKSFELRGFRSALSDWRANPKKPLYQLKDLQLRATDIDGRSPIGVALSFAAAPGGTLKLQGKVDPAVPSVDAKVKIAKLLLSPLQPYLEPYLTLALRSASVSTDGALRYGVPKAGSKIAYDGSFSLDTLRLSAPGSKETYLGWEALQIPKLKLTVEPNNLQIKEVRLKKPQGQLIINEDKTVNLAKIVKAPPAKKSAAPASSPLSGQKESLAAKTPPQERPQKPGQEGADSFPFSIGKVVVEDGNLIFADLSLQPKFMTRIHSLKGSVSRLSSAADSLAEIQLDGGVDQFGYTKITGVLDLHDIKRSSEINMVFQNVELTSVTPYSGKFAGRSIKSGKLSADLTYKIQDNQMLGDNKVIVDNLELGEHVDSPEAINLPLDLAVALLKDSSGKIDIGLPVSGDLNDPQFSIGPLIWKAFANLITKAVTAPFRALGALFGGGAEEKLDAVAFAAGQTELLPPEKEKLKKLSELLQKRPQLQVVVQGQYSPEADGLEFKRNSLHRAVGTLAGEEAPAGEDPGPLDLDDGKTRRALEKIFTERFGAAALAELNRGVKDGTVKAREGEEMKPKKDKAGTQNRFLAIIQSAKLYRLVPGAKSPEQSALLTAEIYARLLESEPVSEQELRQLASQRAQSVTAELADSAGVPPNRIATKDPASQPNDEGLSVKLALDALPSAP